MPPHVFPQPKGGRLKLLGRGETVPAFDDIAFNKEIGVVHGKSRGSHLISPGVGRDNAVACKFTTQAAQYVELA